MTTPTNTTPSGAIVVGVDGSKESDAALVWAIDEARLQQRDLLIAHTERAYNAYEQSWLTRSGISPRSLTDQIHRDALELLERCRVTAVEDGQIAGVETLLRVGDARDTLLELSREAALVVVGSRGHGRLVGLLLGSVSGALARQSSCPVAVVRSHGEDHERGGVLVGGDGSKDTLDTIEVAFREASDRGVSLTVAHCLWDPLVSRVGWAPLRSTDPGYEQLSADIADALAGMRERFPDVEVAAMLAKGSVDACLIDLSGQHELLVVGRHARSLGERLSWGGLTTEIVERAASPVIVVP